MSEELECPITRAPIEFDDKFVFITQNEKKIAYSARAYSSWISRGRLIDPMTRTVLAHTDLKKLQKCLHKKHKNKLIQKFNRCWHVMCNRSMRSEYFELFEGFVNLNGEDTMYLRLTACFLLMVKEVLGPAVYRSLLNQSKRAHPVAANATKMYAETLDQHIICDFAFYEHSMQTCFNFRTDDDPPEPFKTLVPELPTFEIVCNGSISQAIAMSM